MLIILIMLLFRRRLIMVGIAVEERGPECRSARLDMRVQAFDVDFSAIIEAWTMRGFGFLNRSRDISLFAVLDTDISQSEISKKLCTRNPSLAFMPD